MAKPYYQQHRLLPSCLALITALMPLGWCQELRASSSSDRFNATARIRQNRATRQTLRGQDNDDPLWASRDPVDRAVLEPVSADITDRLFRHAGGLKALLLAQLVKPQSSASHDQAQDLVDTEISKLVQQASELEQKQNVPVQGVRQAVAPMHSHLLI